MENIGNIIKDIYSFSHFVNLMEVEYGELDSWLNMEIINAIALDDWDRMGRPVYWSKWESEYMNKAKEVLLIFLDESKYL